jgi:3-oxoacyl-[acyl-carrier protein] reductase
VTASGARRVALVTGASRGIGRACAIALGKSGHRIVVNFATNENAARETVEAIKSAGGEAVAIGADVGDPATNKSL